MLILAGCDASTISSPSTPSSDSSPTPSSEESSSEDVPTENTPENPKQSDPIFVGAGDIAFCGWDGDEATALLLDQIFADDPPGMVFTLGDNAYDDGSIQEFTNCYQPTWGRHKSHTAPSVGNHEYNTEDATGYFAYFGAAAGDPTKGYTSYDLGTWHIIVLNSNCSYIGGCTTGSPQYQWLQADLAQSKAFCTLATMHRPRFSSGVEHGSSTSVKQLWELLYQYNVDVVLVGHEHNYERFALQNPDGMADPLHGIRQFVVGTGGADLYPFGEPIANSAVRNADTHGVLKLSLHPTSYDWVFVPVAGKIFTDTGTTACH